MEIRFCPERLRIPYGEMFLFFFHSEVLWTGEVLDLKKIKKEFMNEHRLTIDIFVNIE